MNVMPFPFFSDMMSTFFYTSLGGSFLLVGLALALHGMGLEKIRIKMYK